MKEPSIRIGFIVFRPGMEQEIEVNAARGHWWTAKEWVERNGKLELYRKVVSDPTIKVYDYDDFVTDFIGAIKLHAVSGQLKCYVPRTIPNQSKSFLKRYFRNKGYVVYGDVSNENNDNDYEKQNISNNTFCYNQTVVINKAGKYAYNPMREGD